MTLQNSYKTRPRIALELLTPTKATSFPYSFEAKCSSRGNMNCLHCLLLVLLSVASLNVVAAEDRAPHGLANESPVAFSPSAYNFFHPNTRQIPSKRPCGDSSSSCSPLPMAAQVGALEGQENRDSESQSSLVRPGGIAGIVICLALAAFLAVGVYYVTVTRRNNMRRANAVQPDAKCSQSV